MKNQTAKSTCSCEQPPQKETGNIISGFKKAIGVLPSFVTSLVIAFFPKCPFCWAVYMSMFGALGLAKLPYMPWLLPLLLLFLGFHLFMIFKKIPQKGTLPFLMSLTGSAFLISERLLFPAMPALIIAGMILIISGSLLNSFITVHVRSVS